MARPGVLFVCMGNICRSPMAEAIFAQLVEAAGADILVDSAGTGGWHAGEEPDPRTLAVLRHHQIVPRSRARQVHPSDFTTYTWLVAMDHQNVHGLLSMGAPREKVRLLMEFHPDPPSNVVGDPYYGGKEGFETMYAQLVPACEGLLRSFLQKP